MPVKVRCSGCQKILNAPERARGKAIKCPECATVIKVPAEKQAVRQAAPPPSSSSVIANLDLNRLEDAENRICPNCGADVAPEDIECPKCEVMLETGQLSEKKKARRMRKGMDPALYYKNLPSDAWEFLKENRKTVLRSVLISVLYAAIFIPVALLSIYVSKPPLKVFWGGIAFITFLIPPGWAWFLHVTTIQTTLENKKKLPKRILFDLFQCVALGIKFFVWTLAMGAPLHAIALLAWWFDWPMVALAAAGTGLLFALLAFPVAMVHMSMPVTMPAWQFWTVDAIAFRNALPSLYWLMFLLLTMLPAAAVLGLGLFFTGEGLQEMIDTMNKNVEIQRANDFIAENSGKNAPKFDKSIRDKADEKPEAVEWSAAVVPSICWIVATAMFGALSLFNMRANGLFAFVFRERLNLISMVDEIKYVPKPVLDDDELEELRRQLNGKKVGFGLVGLGLFSTAIATSMSFSFDIEFAKAISYAYFICGSICLVSGVGMMIYFALKRPAGLKWGAIVTGASLFYLGLAAWLFLGS